MKNTNDLIKDLTADKSALTRDLSPLVKSFIAFFSVAFIYSIATYLYSPLSFHILNTTHFVEMVLMALMIFLILTLGFTALIPGAKMRIISISTLMIFSLFIIAQVYQANSHPIYASIRPNCEFEAICVSLFTTVLGHFYLKRFPFSKHQIFTTLIVYGLPLTSTLILHSACKSEWLHVLSCHMLSPFIIPTTYLLLRKKS